MKKTIEIKAKTVEEAVAEAVKKLGAPSADAVKVTVVQEAKKGFLGLGAADAIIRAEYEVKDAAKAPAKATASKPAAEEKKTETKSIKEVPAKKETDTAAAELGTAYAEATQSELIAYEFIKKVMADMSLDVTVTMIPGDNDDVVVKIDGEDAGILIGHHGETLDAIQYLANLAANKKEEGEKREYARITIDIEDYRAKREAALRSLARKKAAQVQKYKKSIMLEPMNPYERRIIHSEVQNIEGVSTNSIGTDNNRRIVIYLEESGMPAQEPKKKKAKSADPINVGSSRSKKIPATFSEDDVKDPFDIDLSAAMPQDDYADEE